MFSTSAADPRIAPLAEMSACAHRLGMAFAAEAEQASDVARKVEFFHLFGRCFFSVRVAISLELRLERKPGGLPREAASDGEDLSDREDRADRDPPEASERDAPDYDRERDRETERASLPLLLRTLDGVVVDAAKLPGPAPAELPTLRELLAHAKAAPGTAVRPKRPETLRTRLSGSGAMALASPSAPRLASNVGAVLAMRRATGPPRR